MANKVVCEGTEMIQSQTNATPPGRSGRIVTTADEFQHS